MCQEGFEDEKDLTKHEEIKHAEQIKIPEDNKVDSHTHDMDSEKFQCDVCITKFSSDDILLQHMQSNHKENVLEYVCSKCKFVSRTESGMKRHEDIYCEECQICLNDRVEYDVHMSLHKKCKSYKCEFKAKQSKELQEHVTEIHGRFTCLLCRQECKDEDSLKVHQQSHEKKIEEVRKDEKEIEEVIHKTKCQLCEYKSMESSDINSHIKEKHINLEVRISNEDQTVLKCDLCGYSCELQIQLKKHKEKNILRKTNRWIMV